MERPLLNFAAATGIATGVLLGGDVSISYAGGSCPDRSPECATLIPIKIIDKKDYTLAIYKDPVSSVYDIATTSKTARFWGLWKTDDGLKVAVQEVINACGTVEQGNLHEFQGSSSRQYALSDPSCIDNIPR
jgi:hypothetical protein